MVSTSGEKKLATGQVRYIVKAWDKKLWGVYDLARACWPVRGPETGEVAQKLESKEAAEAEAERLNAAHPTASTSKRRAKSPASTDSAPVHLDPVKPAETVEPEELEDYGEMSAEDRKKYEDGLIEKGVY